MHFREATLPRSSALDLHAGSRAIVDRRNSRNSPARRSGRAARSPRKLDGVVPSQAMLVCQLRSASNQRLGNIHDEIVVPVIVIFAHDASIIFRTHRSFPAFAREGSPCLRKGDQGDRGDLSASYKRLDRRTLRFGYIKLYQSARVYVENHRRSSTTICETGLPLMTTEGEPPLGLPPFQVPIPFRLSSRASAGAQPKESND